MKSIYLLGPHRFHVEVARRLPEYGVDVALFDWYRKFTGYEEVRAAAPKALHVEYFQLYGARLPDGFPIRPQPATAADLTALAPWESTVLQMMDRRNYDKRSVQELRHFYRLHVGLWRTLLDARRPDAVVFHGTPHQGHDFALYQLCRHDGIATPIVERTYLNERCYFRNGVDDTLCPSRDELEAARAAAPDGDIARPAGSYYDKLNRDLNDVREIERELAPWSRLKELLRPAYLRRSRKRVIDPIFGISQYQPTLLEYRREEFRTKGTARRAFYLYRSLTQKLDLAQPYVYFPLHFQPERTTLPDGGLFGDQLHAVALAAAALPQGWRLIVKEHPRQFRRGVLFAIGRSETFYRQLAAIDGVQLAPLETSSEELVGRAQAVATVTGTSGWEAVQAGIPALVFGCPWYLHAPGVHPVDGVDSTRRVLDEIAGGKARVDVGLVQAYARVITDKYTFRACFGEKLMTLAKVSEQENGDLLARAIASKLSPSSPSSVVPDREQIAR